MLQRARGEEDRDANDVNHEQGNALQVDDKDLAGERGDGEEGRADEEDLDDEDGEEWLKVSPEMIRTDAGVVSPGREGAEISAEASCQRKRRRW